MPNNDTVAEIVETAESAKKTPFALPKSKTAYAIYGVGALLAVAGVVGAIAGRKQLSDETDDNVAESTETSSN